MTHDRPAVRLVLAISLDGRLAPPSGGLAQLGGPSDRRVLEEALGWADAVLFGANTLRAHRSTCLIRDPDLLERRHREGRPAQPDAIVASRVGQFPLDWPFFQQPLRRHLLSPTPALAGFDGWIKQGSTWAMSFHQLHQQGWTKLVVLGGARLAGSLLSEDQIDELQLTLTPRLLGGAHSWFPMEDVEELPATLADPAAWALTESRPMAGDELLVRYRRMRSY